MSVSGIDPALKRLVYTYKKPHCAGAQAHKSLKCARADWFAHRVPAISARPERVVFLDETSVETNLTPLRGRSLRGRHLTASAPFGSWRAQTSIAGLGPSDLVAPWVTKGAMDGSAFVASIRDVPVPEIEPGTVFGPLTRTNGVRDLTSDNLATHKNKYSAMRKT